MPLIFHRTYVGFIEQGVRNPTIGNIYKLTNAPRRFPQELFSVQKRSSLPTSPSSNIPDTAMDTARNKLDPFGDYRQILLLLCSVPEFQERILKLRHKWRSCSTGCSSDEALRSMVREYYLPPPETAPGTWSYPVTSEF